VHVLEQRWVGAMAVEWVCLLEPWLEPLSLVALWVWPME